MNRNNKIINLYEKINNNEVGIIAIFEDDIECRKCIFMLKMSRFQE